jgi:hypothetical protein
MRLRAKVTARCDAYELACRPHRRQRDARAGRDQRDGGGIAAARLGREARDGAYGDRHAHFDAFSLAVDPHSTTGDCSCVSSGGSRSSRGWDAPVPPGAQGATQAPLA